MGFRNLPERAKASWSSPSCSPLPDSRVWALHHCNPCTLWRVWVTLTLNRKHYQNVERFLSTYGLIRDRYQHFQRFLSAIRSNINIMILNLKKKKTQKNVRQCARELRCAIRMLQDNFDIWPLVVLKERALVVWRWKKNRRQGYTVHVTIDLRLSRGLPSHGSLVDKNGQSDLEGAFYRLHTWGHRHKVRTQRSVVAKGIEQRPQKGKLC